MNVISAIITATILQFIVTFTEKTDYIRGQLNASPASLRQLEKGSIVTISSLDGVVRKITVSYMRLYTINLKKDYKIYLQFQCHFRYYYSYYNSQDKQKRQTTREDNLMPPQPTRQQWQIPHEFRILFGKLRFLFLDKEANLNVSTYHWKDHIITGQKPGFGCSPYHTQLSFHH